MSSRRRSSPTCRRITAAQNEALDLLAEVAEEVCLYSPFVPGDIQLLNNHVIFHGRTAYEDDSASQQERLLFRLWLSMPNSRRLPRGFENFGAAASLGRCAAACSSRRPARASRCRRRNVCRPHPPACISAAKPLI